MNFIQLVGRIKVLPKRQHEYGNEAYSELVLEVRQNFSNTPNKVLKDDFQVRIWRGMSDHVLEKCQISDLLAIKGRIHISDGQPYVVAEHFELLSA